MAVVTTKSASIINLDATPILANTTGEGAEGDLRCANDSCAQATTDSVGSIYRLIRIPTNAKVKRLILNSVGIVAAAADFDVAYSDSLTDGTQQQFLQRASPIVQITGPADNKLFGAAQSIAAVAQADRTFQTSSLFTLPYQNMPLWAVLVAIGCVDFSADPGGFFDLVLKLTTISTTGGTLGLEADFVE